jgi:hypothetical protein
MGHGEGEVEAIRAKEADGGRKGEIRPTTFHPSHPTPKMTAVGMWIRKVAAEERSAGRYPPSCCTWKATCDT